MELHLLLLVQLTFHVLVTAAERNDVSAEEGNLQLTAQTGQLLELALRNSLRKNVGIYAVLLQQDKTPETNPMVVKMDPAEFKHISEECLDCDGLCWKTNLSKCFKIPAYRCVEPGDKVCKGQIKDPELRKGFERLLEREHRKQLDCDDCWGRCWINVSKTCHQLIPSQCAELPSGKFCPGKAPLKEQAEMQLQQKAHDLTVREKEIAAAKHDLEVSPELDKQVKNEVEAIRERIENQNGTLAATPGETQNENDPKAHPVQPEEWYDAVHPEMARAKSMELEYEKKIQREEEEIKQKQEAKGVPENKLVDKKIEEDEKEEKQEAEQAKERGIRTVEAIRESASVRMAYPSQILAVLLSVGLSQLLSRIG